MRLTWILLPVIAFGLVASGLLLTSTLTRAVQDPSLAIDMVIADNTYDETTNAMAVAFNPGADFCSATAANPAQHTHTAHVIVQNVEDLVGWQVRLNYEGGQFRPNTVNFMPFTDNTTGQNISFNNLPLDTSTSNHRDLVSASSIPAGAAGPQTAAFGATYIGNQNFAISPDTPAKPAPDDTSYSAPGGGVLASVNLQVVGDQSGQLLFIDMDDGTPNTPGSGVAIFDGTASNDVLLPEGKLGDASHAEGTTCQAATPTATPSPAPTATATPTPGPGGGGTPGPGGTSTRTATPAAGARTPTRTPVVSPAALPPTGDSDDGGSFDLPYLLLFAALAVPVSGAAYGVVRLRRR